MLTYKVGDVVLTSLGLGKIKDVDLEYQNYIVEGSNWIWIFTEKEVKNV
jgi:hypothetical protein